MTTYNIVYDGDFQNRAIIKSTTSINRVIIMAIKAHKHYNFFTIYDHGVLENWNADYDTAPYLVKIVK